MLMRLGARVRRSKWSSAHYFKHEETAAFLLEHGMDPNHMNWHRFTLLHHMAAEGELGKARLLLDHGADIDAIDDEYCSTPLGVAARRGQGAMVALLLASQVIKIGPLFPGRAWCRIRPARVTDALSKVRQSLCVDADQERSDLWGDFHRRSSWKRSNVNLVHSMG